MWFFLWFFLSAILIGATLWSLYILMHQKKAWETFAQKHNFLFQRGTFMGPAEMKGSIGDYKIAFFTAERDGPDIRSRRYMTTVELQLSEGFVDGGVMGTKEMIPFMQSLDKLHAYTPKIESWDKAHSIYAIDDAVLDSYLTAERAEALAGILNTKNADVLILFNDKQVVLRLETIDPMQDPDKIEKILKRLMALCDKARVKA